MPGEGVKELQIHFKGVKDPQTPGEGVKELKIHFEGERSPDPW